MEKTALRGVNFPGLPGVTYIIPSKNEVQDDATDLDALIEPGRYRYTPSTVNLPDGLSSGFVDVVVQSSSFTWQIFHDSTYMTTANRIRAAGYWGELTWENPPLAVGVEYRTTKRYKGSPVYAKLISVGELGDADTSFSVAHGVTCTEFTTVDIHAKAGLVTIRFANGGQDGQVQAGVNSTDVFITLAGRGYWGYTAWAYLEYIKN